VRAGVLRAAELPRDALGVLGPTGAKRIDTLVRDLVETSAATGDIVQGEEVGAAMADLRTFMFERVYLAPARRQAAVEAALVGLFRHHAQHLPPAVVPDASDAERVADWLAGMTDRYALRAWGELSGRRA
jgi:dGTPase